MVLRYLLGQGVTRHIRTFASVVNQTVLKTMGKPNVIFVLGGPGAGKGTQCDLIVKEFGYTHLSAGDLLRAERKREDSEVGQLIEDCIVNGKIVPVAITCGLLEKAMMAVMEKDADKDNFLIDGFPRNKDNLDGWTEQMGEKANVKYVLFFDCGEDVCINRCLSRGESSGRTDDNLASLKKRMETYLSSTKPIIDYYAEKGMVHTINAAPTPDQVFDKVKAVLSSQ